MTQQVELAARLSAMTISEELALPTEERVAMIRAWHAVQGDVAWIAVQTAQVREAGINPDLSGEDPVLSSVSELGNAW